MSTVLSVKCSDCGEPFSPDMPNCPKCGSENRDILVRDIPDLWPTAFPELEEPTPLLILKQQGRYLGQKTSNLVIGEVRTIAGPNFVRHFFDLCALMGVNYSLFYAEHDPFVLYPVEIKSSSVLGFSGKVNSREEFMGKLKEILNATETKEKIQALIAQSKS